VTVRQADRGRYEVALSPGAGVPDLVAAVGVLPPGVVYTSHRPAAPGERTAAVLLFQTPPADPAGSAAAGVPARLAPASGPPSLPGWRWLPEPAVDADPADRESAALDEAMEHAPVVLGHRLTSVAPAGHGRHLVRGLTACGLAVCDPDAPPAAVAAAEADVARHEQAA
jgi:hypothetical protein